MRDVRKDLLGVAKNVMGLVADLYCSINVEYSLSPQSFFETLKMYMVFRSGVQLWGSVQSAKLLPQFNALLVLMSFTLCTALHLSPQRGHLTWILPC